MQKRVHTLCPICWCSQSRVEQNSKASEITILDAHEGLGLVRDDGECGDPWPYLVESSLILYAPASDGDATDYAEA